MMVCFGKEFNGIRDSVNSNRRWNCIAIAGRISGRKSGPILLTDLGAGEVGSKSVFFCFIFFVFEPRILNASQSSDRGLCQEFGGQIRLQEIKRLD